MKNNKWYIPLLILSLLVTSCSIIPSQPPTPVESPTTLPTPTISNTPSLSPTAAVTSTPAEAWMRLNPPSGPPGTVVQVEGYLPGGLPPDQLQQQNNLTHADICWGGCTNGLPEEGLEVHWSQSEPGHFRLQFVVPSIPWLANDGLHKLEPGDTTISLQHLDPNKVNCAVPDGGGKVCAQPTEISASFYLTNGYAGTECQEVSACGWIKLFPAQGAPGDQIQVQGWAPLVSIIGQPFGYQLVLETVPDATSSAVLLTLGNPLQQAMDGSFTASFQVPQSTAGSVPLTPGSYTLALQAMGLGQGLKDGKSGAPVMLAPTQFDILAAPAWVARQRSAPLWIQPGSTNLDPALTIDPGQPERMAYCAAGVIMVSRDGGKSWNSIPTAGIKDVTLPGDLALFDNNSPSTCSSITLDPSHPDSFYAVFSAASKQWGAPPVYYLGFATTDKGKTWQLAPVTQLSTQNQSQTGEFGGFFDAGNAVQALFYDRASGASTTPPALQVKQTTDGGLTWSPAALACPANGPCLHWGAQPAEVAGMGAPLPQEVLASYDQGQDWVSTDQSVELRMNGPHELVALSQREALLISGGARYPLLYTPDGGKSWQALALPQLPGANSGAGEGGFSGLQMLSNGSLAAMDQGTGVWWVLSPTANDWCSTGIKAPGFSPVLLASAGNQIWWFSPGESQPESAPGSSFACQP